MTAKLFEMQAMLPSPLLVKEFSSLIKQAKDYYYNGSKVLKIEAEDYPKVNAHMKKNVPKIWVSVGGKIAITDTVYDTLEDQLRKIKPDAKVLVKVGADVTTKEKVKLPFTMGSLDKYTPATLSKWATKHKGPYVLSDKIDGVSIGIQSKIVGGKRVTKAYTRGNGSVGQDVSHLIPYLKLPKITSDITIRGEIAMSKSDFKAKWSKEFANARNLTSGLVGRKKLTNPALHDLKLFVHEVISPRGVPSKQLAELKKEGFLVVPHKVVEALNAKVISDYYEKRRRTSDYNIDGLVITQDVRTERVASGNPDYSIAFKDMSLVDKATARVMKVIWEESKHGKLAPVVVVTSMDTPLDAKKPIPLRLSETSVTRASGFNAKNIIEKRIGPGAIVTVLKRGDIIPYIEEVITSAKKIGLPPKSMGAYEWDENETDFMLVDKESNATVGVKRLNHFFKTMGVEYFGIGIISKFYEEGFDTIEKILKMKPADMMKVPGIQSKMATKIYQGIQVAMKDVYLPSIMDASSMFGRNFGTSRHEAVMDAYYPDIMKWGKLSEQAIAKKIVKVHGFEAKLASQFAANFGKFLAWFNALGVKKYHYDEHDVETKIESDRLSGEVVYLTGFRDDEVVKLIEAHGGTVASGFNIRTTMLIVKDDSTTNTKVDVAKEKGMPVLTKHQFISDYKLKD